MAARPGWKSRMYGTLYEWNDVRLSGYGVPPSDPEFQTNYPGQGRFALQETVINGDPGNLAEV